MAEVTFGRHVATAGYLTPDHIPSELEIEGWLKGPWNKMVGDSIQHGKDFTFLEADVPAKPVYKYVSEFEANRTDRLIVPQMRRTDFTVAYGDDQLQGKEASRELYMTDLQVNAIAIAELTKTGPMNDLRALALVQAMSVKPGFLKWWSEYLNWSIMTKGLFEGYSHNVTLATASHGLGTTKRYHPNFYVADQGFVSNSNDSDTYKASIVAALTTLDAAATAARKMSGALVRKLKANMWRKLQRPATMHNGKPFHLWYLHPDQMAQLGEDDDVKRATEMAHAGQGIGPNPLLTGAEFYYKGFAFFESSIIAPEIHYYDGGTDLLLIGPVSGSGSSIAEISIHENLESSTESEQNLKAGVIFGEGAMNYGMAGRPKMVGQNSDFGRRDAMSWQHIPGASRRDFANKPQSYSDPTATVDHKGSMIVVTNSPPVT